MSGKVHDFEEFMRQRVEAARAYVNGDADPLGRLATDADPATFFSPRGDLVRGAQAVDARYRADARGFAAGNDTTIEVLQMGASEDVAYWVGVQRANVHLQGRPEPTPFNLRVTEVFRREGSTWKLVHRHADPLTSE